MSVFRKKDQQPTPPPRSTTNTREQSSAGAANQPEPAPLRIPPHVERALITLTTKMQQCLERLDTIEHRLDELSESTMNTPSHSDVMEVRMHSAKLAAELARATVELRGEIGMASDEARRAARLSRNMTEEEAPVSLPVDVDLTASGAVDIRPVTEDEDQGGNGWTASA